MNNISRIGTFIDSVISHMSPNRRILYFHSTNRQIIEKSLQSSCVLPELLRLPSADLNVPEESLLRHLGTRKLCLNLASSEVYKAAGSLARLELQDAQNLKFLYLKDFQVFSKRETLQSMMLKAFLDTMEKENRQDVYLLISSSLLVIPDGFSNEMELIREPAVSREDMIRALKTQISKEAKARNLTGPNAQPWTTEDLDYCARNLCALEEEQINSVFFKLQDHFCKDLLERLPDYVREEKRKEEQKNPSLRFIEVEKDPCIAGLDNYTDWLDDRLEDFYNPEKAEERGTPAPKGVLLCGVPGTGKTQMAKQTAWRMGYGKISLIRFDISRLLSKYVGEPEAKMEHFLNRISANAPCVMLIDEIEKTFQDDDGTSSGRILRQMLGQLLSWMQDRKANVFTFITANRIDSLPPELLRDGRISGRFFAFLPTYRDLMSIMWFKLEPLAERYLFDPRFCSTIRSQCAWLRDPKKRDDPNVSAPPVTLLDTVLNEGVRGENGERFTGRTPFLTGANMETLLEITNRELRKNNALDGCGISLYREQMLKCFRSPNFIPQGQSNMEDIVNIWLKAQKNQYQEVSRHALLPFYCFQDGKFTDSLPKPQSDYDRYLQNTMKKKIEDAWQTREDRRKAIRKIAADS